MKQVLDARIIKIASFGLKRAFLLKSISDLYDTFEKMKAYLNVCGEGGEYESLVLDSPLHKSKIIIDDFDIIDVSKDDYAPVSYCII